MNTIRLYKKSKDFAKVICMKQMLEKNQNDLGANIIANLNFTLELLTGTTLVSVDEHDNAIGFCHFHKDTKNGETVLHIKQLFVAEKFRNEGNGTFLLDQAYEYASNRGINDFLMDVSVYGTYPRKLLQKILNKKNLIKPERRSIWQN